MHSAGSTSTYVKPPFSKINDLSKNSQCYKVGCAFFILTICILDQTPVKRNIENILQLPYNISGIYVQNSHVVYWELMQWELRTSQLMPLTAYASKSHVVYWELMQCKLQINHQSPFRSSIHTKKSHVVSREFMQCKLICHQRRSFPVYTFKKAMQCIGNSCSGRQGPASRCL